MRLRRAESPSPTAIERFPIQRPLDLPEGVTEKQLWDSLSTLSIDDAPASELQGYIGEAFWRVAHTLSLAEGIEGTALELGANPYYITVAMREFTKLDFTLANYFGEAGVAKQQVTYTSVSGEQRDVEMRSDLFNIEEERFPYADASFDLVTFCEIIEHLLEDPCHTLSEINRVLKPGGSMILTTPNVARLINVLRMINGSNLHDPYSGYGPYGRHNREYNRHELWRLLSFMGFEFDVAFTADSTPDHYDDQMFFNEVAPLIDHRREDLGQYIFVRARKVGEPQEGKPSFLYRSRDDIVDYGY